MLNLSEFFNDTYLKTNSLQESIEDDIGDVSEFEKPDYWGRVILDILKRSHVHYTLNPKTKVCNVDGDVYLYNCDLESFGNIKFGTINGSFNCSFNKLTSLEGCPKKVMNDFNCSFNKLTSLEGAPKYIGGSFYCDHNQLTTLEGALEYVGRNFYCMDNQLTTLGDIRSKVKGKLFANENPLNGLQESREDDIGEVETFDTPTYRINKFLEILKKRGVKYTLNPKTDLYDVDGDVCLNYCNLRSFEGVNFGTVTGSFYCEGNYLISLIGSPRQVWGNFYCLNNHLVTLTGAPEYIGKSFSCSGNNLTTLEYSPKQVGRLFDCSSNQLITLEGAPQIIKDSFNCYYNHLTSLKGAPQRVEGDFNCYYNALTTLEEAPKHVGKIFNCSNNRLITLKGAPNYVGGDFECKFNLLTTLGNIRSKVKGKIFKTGNPLNNLRKSINKNTNLTINGEDSMLKENTIAQFFSDSGFIPPKTQFSFDFGFDSGVESDMKLDSYDGIPDSILDISESPSNPQSGLTICSDYYMFNDPGTRTNPDLRTPLSSLANQTNKEYHRKDLSNIQSASDVHLETLEQPAAEFPRHERIVSQMEPSVLDQSNENEIVFQQPTMIEDVEYPKGTRVIIESSPSQDSLYEDPQAKLCPICENPYVGDACSCCKDATPSKNAIKIIQENKKKDNIINFSFSVKKNNKFLENEKNEFGDVSEFESPTYWTKKILEILKEKRVRPIFNPKTRLYDVYGDVDLNNCNLESLGNIFGDVTGVFSCSNNRLTSLEGAPRKVYGDFWCCGNLLTNLRDSPSYVGGDFNCSSNQLVTLEDVPQRIVGDFFCDHNNLTTLKGAPRQVLRGFFCRHNKLKTLEGSPERVNFNFCCQYNQLLSLIDGPDYIGGRIYCQDNPDLKDKDFKEAEEMKNYRIKRYD